MLSPLLLSVLSFNPRTRVGCDATFTKSDFYNIKVSIHAPAWGATRCVPKKLATLPSFNPRTRVGCDIPCPRIKRTVEGFNPRTRVGCDIAAGAPAADPDSFNPRTRVGCDRTAGPGRGQGGGFNPRTRVGCDVRQGGRAVQRDGVSIHAPAWGATCRGQRQRHRQRGFNPRTRVGCDAAGVVEGVTDQLFQSTHPRGVRPQGKLFDLYLSKFQSTHPRGVRPARHCSCCVEQMSFNPRTRVGCDISKAFDGAINPKMSFNPRTRVGCDCFHVLSSRFP